jgi:hypothetical protein
VQGRDLSRAAMGNAGENPNDCAFISLPVPITEARRYGFAEYRGLRTPRYTYVRSIKGPWLLYDHREDPYQMRNLCNKPGAKSIQAALDRELNSRLRAVKDDFLPARDYIARAGVGHYREVNIAVGHVKSPWGDWESTLST